MQFSGLLFLLQMLYLDSDEETLILEQFEEFKVCPYASLAGLKRLEKELKKASNCDIPDEIELVVQVIALYQLFSASSYYSVSH